MKLNVKKDNHSGTATASIISDLKDILVIEISNAR